MTTHMNARKGQFLSLASLQDWIESVGREHPTTAAHTLFALGFLLGKIPGLDVPDEVSEPRDGLIEMTWYAVGSSPRKGPTWSVFVGDDGRAVFTFGRAGRVMPGVPWTLGTPLPDSVMRHLGIK